MKKKESAKKIILRRSPESATQKEVVRKIRNAYIDSLKEIDDLLTQQSEQNEDKKTD